MECIFEKQFEFYIIYIKKNNNDIIVIIKCKTNDDIVSLTLFTNANILVHNDILYIYNIYNNYTIDNNNYTIDNNNYTIDNNNYTIDNNNVKFDNISLINIKFCYYNLLSYNDVIYCIHDKFMYYNFYTTIYENFKHLSLHVNDNIIYVNNKFENEFICTLSYPIRIVANKFESFNSIEIFKIFHPEYFIAHKLAIHDE